jgi:hypothetical protein
MNEDEIITLGQYAEDLLHNECFNVLAAQYTTNITQNLLSTAPAAKQEREDLYNYYLGYTNFLVHLKAVVDEKNRLLNPAPSEETDAQDFD